MRPRDEAPDEEHGDAPEAGAPGPDARPRRAEPVRTARLHGLHRGADVSGEVELTLEERGLRLAIAGGPTLPVVWAALDGVHHAGSTLTLYLMGDDVLELDDVDNAAALARTVTARACRLGELTLALRGLGSVRARPGSEHQRFYGPLLAARRALESARTPEAQWQAADAEWLATSVRETLAAFAEERFPDVPADRRALEAELLDYAEGLLRALDRLAAAREAARRAPADARFAHWREWASALRDVFAEQDRAWIATLPALCDPRGRQGGFWRRLLGRGRRAPAIALLLLPTLAGTLGAQGPGAPDAGPRETVRVPGATARALAARGFDVVTVVDGAPHVVAGPTERARLAGEGFPAERLTSGAEARLRALREAGQSAQQAARVYRPFDDATRGVRAWLDSLQAALPGIVRVDSVGRSWEGRPILAVRVGAAAAQASGDDPARPNVVFMATYHAREWIATETALRWIRHLATSADARTRDLAATRDVWIVPVVNPDGYQYTFAGDRLWRKNRRPLASGVVGVDLNRNHAERWGRDERGSSSLPASEVYRGTAPASELEVQAVQALHERLRPVLGVSWHSFGDLLLYPPGYAEGLLPGDLGVYRAIAGTDLAPAAHDRVAGTTQDWYHPGPGWQLYVTNGDYLDWASAQGTLAFTPELTSGCTLDCSDGYYGFLFPDDEARIERVFQDQLPFALDVLDAAADPRGFRSRTTELGVPTLAVESVSPVVRVRVPTPQAPTAAVRVARGTATVAVPVRADTVPSFAWETRLVSGGVGARPAGLEVTTAGTRQTWRTLLVGGGEPGETGWELDGWFTPGVGIPPLAGRAYWETGGGGTLRSPAVQVPTDADTVTIAWWQQHEGNAIALEPAGQVRVLVDDGAARTVHLVQGNAGVWYPEMVRVGGVRGRLLRVELAGGIGRWRLDEVSVLAEGTALPTASGVATLAVRPSANPVRGPQVTFAWPADAGAGEIAIYDFGGRRVWQRAVAAGEPSATWDVVAQRLANGAYVVVARAGARTGRLTLYVAR